jgi:large subunit ribosomal protein L21
MQAVIELKGKQYLVEPGKIIRSLRVEGEPGGRLNADRVLATIDGETVALGKPALAGTSAVLEIVRQTKSPKIHIMTYQPKKRRVRRMGYRDKISYLRVISIEG